MLSIIISSYQPHYFTALEKNIAETIGIPYEIIKIDNLGLMGICKAYNKGAAKAQFENLLFLHEDVKFESFDWGKILVGKLAVHNVGIIGLAGSDYLPNSPATWWTFKNHKFISIKQFDKTRFVKEFSLNEDKKVKLLDGVFLALRADVFTKYKFNEGLAGFHGYDIELSALVSENYQNWVISNLSLIHYSQGKANRQWLQALIEARKHYKVRNINSSKAKEYQALKYLYNLMNEHGFSKTEIVSTIIPYANPNKIGYSGFLNICKLVSKRLLR